MECHTLLTSNIISTPGTPRLPHNTLEATMPQQERSDTTRIISKSLKEDLQVGEQNKKPEHESLKLPTPEEIEQEKYPAPRVLTMTNEEFYQWRQILGTYKKIIKKNILDSLSKT
jgi:hypothetical protein